MNKLIFILLLIPLFSISQSEKVVLNELNRLDSEIKAINISQYNSGMELRKHTKNVVGSIICLSLSAMVLSTANKFESKGSIYFLSGVFAVASISFSISSIFNINKAGKYLQRK